VTAAFDVALDHPARAILKANDIPAEDDLILRRVQFADGRTRAFPQTISRWRFQVLAPASAARWSKFTASMTTAALVDTATHRRLLERLWEPGSRSRRSGQAVDAPAAMRSSAWRSTALRWEARPARGRLAAPCGRGA